MGEVSPETSPKNTMIQDMINSETISKLQCQKLKPLYCNFALKWVQDFQVSAAGPVIMICHQPPGAHQIRSHLLASKILNVLKPPSHKM